MMKVSIAFLALLAYRVGGTRLGDSRNLSDVVADKVLSLPHRRGPFGENPCVQEVPGNKKVIVTDCSVNPAGVIWTLEDGSLHSIYGGCLQAGHGEPVQDGTNMRIKPCKANEPLQKFVFSGTDDEGDIGGTLKLQSNDNLCVTVANDQPILIMKVCSILEPDRRDWSFSYHVYDYLFNQQGAAESGNGINIQGQNVYLGEPVNEHPSSSWHEDDNGMVRNGYGECLQAGHGEVVQDGTHMRVYPCNANNNLQKFKVNEDNGLFKLKDVHQDLCITVAKGDDPILIMKTCPGSTVGGRWDWVFA